MDRASLDADGAPRRGRGVHRQQIPPGERKAGGRRTRRPGGQGVAEPRRARHSNELWDQLVVCRSRITTGRAVVAATKMALKSTLRLVLTQSGHTTRSSSKFEVGSSK